MRLNETVNLHEKAIEELQNDAEQLRKLIEVQAGNLATPKCPLYEEVLDTQLFGLSRQIDFAIRMGLLTREEGKQILDKLERELEQVLDQVQPYHKNEK